MSDIASLQDNELIQTLKSKVDNERRLAVEILELLQQVQDRLLHLKMGYSSLLAFCVQELKYSESTAYRRISALRLSAEVPELKEQLQSGELTFQALAQVHTFLNQEKKHSRKTYTAAEKKDLVQAVTSKNSRQVEQLLAEKSPGLPKPETSRQITSNQRQVVITISAGLDAKLDKMRSRYSHKNPNPTLAELMELMADEILGQEAARQQRAQKRFAAKELSMPPVVPPPSKGSHVQRPPKSDAAVLVPPNVPAHVASDVAEHVSSKAQILKNSHAPVLVRSHVPTPARGDNSSIADSRFPSTSTSPSSSVPPSPSPSPSPSLSAEENVRQIEKLKLSNESTRQAPLEQVNLPKVRPQNPRYISGTVRYQVRMRSGGRCCYVDPATGKRCDSRHRLEIEHIQAVAHGGSNDISNLRLACRNHNTYFAHQAGLDLHQRAGQPRKGRVCS